MPITYTFDVSDGSPVVHIPFPIDHLASEDITFQFIVKGGNPIFFVGPAEVGIEGAENVKDYDAVMRAVLAARRPKVEEQRVEMPQIEEPPEDEGELGPAENEFEQEGFVQDYPANEHTHGGPHLLPPDSDSDEQSPPPRPRIRVKDPADWTDEERDAFRRGALTHSTYSDLYEACRLSFALECAPSLEPARDLTEYEEEELDKLWNAILRVDRLFSGPNRDIEALMGHRVAMTKYAADRVRRVQLRPPLQAANFAPPESAIAELPSKGASGKENAPISFLNSKRARPEDEPPVTTSKRQRSDSPASEICSTYVDGVQHKIKLAHSLSGDSYFALIPQSVLPSGKLLSAAERDWLLEQSDLRREPDAWRPKFDLYITEFCLLPGTRASGDGLDTSPSASELLGTNGYRVLKANTGERKERGDNLDDARFADLYFLIIYDIASLSGSYLRCPGAPSPQPSTTTSDMASKKMQYVRLGESGLKVSRIILGCMSYGTPEWQTWVLREEEGIQHIKEAYDAGINAFDTANVYSNGESERILGKAICQLNLPRDEIVVLSKVFFTVCREPGQVLLGGSDPDAEGYVNQHGLSRKHIFDSVKASLARLQLDYIDVLQCHRFDYDTPIEETMQALHDVVKAGYVRYIGMSSCYAWQFHAMQNYAINNNLTPFISMQNHYSLAYREEEREMFPTLKHLKVGSIPWSPLGRGLLTRPLSEQSKRGAVDRMIGSYHNDATTAIVERVEEISKRKGFSMAQIALAWVMARDGVSAPIVGTTSLENLRELIAAVDVKLSEEEMKYLEEPYKPTKVLGHT
uniref:NADP-dependent oxidoreductase domain-containing protein n=1 Tax=Mycena chlorophos TaxID=658473 RepID=A0ABQ0LQ90_MYCCL|nr:predicted protein [Mycena chlorophos]